ncbi:XRE family transcriptional regulator [Limnobaculum zhutongyuii]|uniref:XRE family transcriptional regulator n=1 Tax=Limnobaculum zhutongyuii TaxID=2498113 RepID=A0A411WI43_9GAMM|nr:helix-turn-helix transcriptional regulator [Limnobaculum zhutongyuii]QBH95754.1 XRE family transcriptional regulator [Limnobaculum zhutongyuii]TQS86137.1 XRE family transcriptional regulator [Limnobaculum zhutongyuii]
MKTFGERLKSERIRLSLSQEELANAGGVKRGAQINYEKNERTPDSNYMSSIANIGVDIQYVLTGKRMTRAEAKRLGIFKPDAYVAQTIASIGDDDDESRDEEPFTMAPPTYRLNKDEWELIQRFRCADLKTKMEVMQLLLSVDMADKTTDDYKPESNENKSAGITVSGSGNRVAGRNYNERKK